jgi:voltage-gated potassium channel
MRSEAKLQRFERYSEWPLAAAALASWIIERVAEEETVMQAATVTHIEELRNEIRALGKQLQARESSDHHA